QLAEGVNIQRIIGDTRDSASPGTVQRIHRIGKKDLHNIKRDFAIAYSTKRHENDALSIKLWVEEMKSQNYNPILFYKEQGESSKTDALDIINDCVNNYDRISKLSITKVWTSENLY
ncbi:hypothetical protein ILUMI_17710, partial [Ignelater luminosus]